CPEVGPAVPGSLLDAPQQVGGAVDRAAAANVGLVLGGVEAAIGGKGQAPDIAQPPGDQLRSAATRAHPHDGAAAWHLALYDLIGLTRYAEGHEGAGDRLVAGSFGERVVRRVVSAAEHDVLAG